MLTGYSSLTNHSIQTRHQDPSPSSAISRLLAAAVINKGFRNLLLTDPLQALAQGYQGEMFPLKLNERKLVLSIQADNLSDFARQITCQEDITQGWSGDWIPVKRSTLVLEPEFA